MSGLVSFLAILLGAVTLLCTTYLLAHDVVLRLWNGLTTPDPEMERTMKTVTVEFSPDAFPVLQSHDDSDAQPATFSAASSGAANAEAVVVVAPFASRVIELTGQDGEQNVWLCTLCLN